VLNNYIHISYIKIIIKIVLGEGIYHHVVYALILTSCMIKEYDLKRFI